MTDWSAQSMGSDPQLLSKRLKRFLEPVPAKELSRLVGCDPRTAENMRGGHWPIARHWLGLLAAFGEDVTEAVFHPEKAAARLEREVQQLERELEERKAALRQHQGEAQSFEPRMAKNGAAHEDRAAGVGGPR